MWNLSFFVDDSPIHNMMNAFLFPVNSVVRLNGTKYRVLAYGDFELIQKRVKVYLELDNA